MPMRIIRADNLIVADDDRGKRANGVRRDSSTLDSTAASRAKQSPPSEVVESAFKTTLDARKAIRGGTS